MITATKIMEEVADAYGFKVDDLLSRQRISRIAEARAVMCYLLSRHLSMSSTEIGKMLGRNHATILHLVSKVDDMLSFPKMYREHVSVVRSIEDKYFKTDEKEKVEHLQEVD